MRLRLWKLRRGKVLWLISKIIAILGGEWGRTALIDVVFWLSHLSLKHPVKHSRLFENGSHHFRQKRDFRAEDGEFLDGFADDFFVYAGRVYIGGIPSRQPYSSSVRSKISSMFGKANSPLSQAVFKTCNPSSSSIT
jgi:hypothetical protein